METKEFDAALGGNEQLPNSANSLKFAASRSVEIAAMTESILRPSKTKLIFQNLPVHMRRRVMSHNCKRLPRRLREGHLEQLKKSGLPPKQKRPSRKYRRRPTNLLEEYTRRQRKNVWLETHIWHAKRFHMIERWGYRLAYRPCDKAFRACYRATSAHCLIQDISYYTQIQVKGPIESIRSMFSCITFSDGLSICAKAYLNGNRKGSIDLYKPNSYPFNYIGNIDYLWVSHETNKELWLFVHPSQAKQVESVLSDIKNESTVIKLENESIDYNKRRKLSSKYTDVHIKAFTGVFNRFRLTGPKSHAVLVKTLKCVEDIEKIQGKWAENINVKECQLHLQEKSEYWKSVSSLSSPSQLPPKIVLSLVVKDPRLSRPNKRTKARNNNGSQVNIESLVKVPPFSSTSPLWNTTVHDLIKSKRITNAQYVEHITKTQLVPGEINEDDPFLQSIPIVLIQRPGSQNSFLKKIGYGCGWDIIIPSGYGLPFWLTFIMFGARSGGLRETESLTFESGKCYLPPDSEAGKSEEMRIECELREKYFRRPPSKRVNFIKLAVPSPFRCLWNSLLKDWGNTSDQLFIVRDKNILNMIQECLDKKSKIITMDNSMSCLVPVYLKIQGKGNLTKHAIICMLNSQDISCKSLMEPHHEDSNAKLRRQKRAEHRILLKKLRNKRIKLKKRLIANKELQKKIVKTMDSGPSAFTTSMRELWLPSDIKTVRNVGIRETMGYVAHGAFSYSEAKSCGVGYVAYNALKHLLEQGLNQVLVRNTTSRKYRVASIQVIK